MESVGKRQGRVRITVGNQMFIPGEPSIASGYVHLPVSYTEKLIDRFSCPINEKSLLSPASVRRLLSVAPVQQKLKLLGLSTQADDYVALYVIPADSVPSQDIWAGQGGICLTHKSPGQLVNTCRIARAETFQLKHDLETSAEFLDVEAKRLVTSIDEAKKLLQVTVQKVHTPHLQVLIQRACNNLASKLGLKKEVGCSWFDLLKTLDKDQWSRVEVGAVAQETLIMASKWLDVNLTTTTADMAKAISYLKEIGDGNDHNDADVIRGNSAAGGDLHVEWDKTFRLASVEDVLGWDELFKLASGSSNSFTEFLDLGPSSLPAVPKLPDLNRQSPSSFRPS